MAAITIAIVRRAITIERAIEKRNHKSIYITWKSDDQFESAPRINFQYKNPLVFEILA